MTDPIFGQEKKGSITDIPIPNSKQTKHNHHTTAAPAGDSDHKLDLSDNFEQQTRRVGMNPSHNMDEWNGAKSRNKRMKTKIIFSVIGILVLGLIASVIFHSADVELEAKQAEAVVLDTYNATNTGTSGTIGFSRVTPFSETIDIFVEGTSEENVQTKASGTLLVTNTGNSAQRFRSTTRFETPDGRVYRAPRSIPIPANGTVEVEVIADVPGDEYNSESGLTFTLPGLEGTALFTQVTATQQTPITGGFSGIINSASDDDIEAGKNTLRKELTEKLQNELVEKIPSGFIVTTAMTEIGEISFKEIPNEEEGGIDLEATAEIAAVIFNKKDFDTFIAASVLDDFAPGDSISITNINDFTLEIETNDFDVQESESFEFSLRSPAERGMFVWTLDEDEIARALAGRSVSQISTNTIEALSGVQSIDVTITPPWRRSIPDNIKKIDITVNK